MSGELLCDDNLSALGSIDSGSVGLVYLDPPFCSGRDYIGSADHAFTDRWDGGIDAYLDWMRPRLQEVWRLLRTAGSLYLHCDWHAGHYLKVMLDEVFGSENFVNEIVWSYRKWSAGKYSFQRNHDTIFFYSRTQSKERPFNQLFMERAASTKKRFGNAKITSGFDADGRRVPSKTGEEESEGVRMDDVWEIPAVAPSSRERLGYPTQKPERLLECIILASSNPGDLVVDPFCGSGTTLAAANRLGRGWIGIDQNPAAIDLCRSRLDGAPLTLAA
jgi:DNA modification methylase